MKTILVLLLLSTSVTAESPRGPIGDQQWSDWKFFELGLSAGTPAGLNFCVGYWFGSTNNDYLTQVCGMHFGSTLKGIQLDFGKTFYRKKVFKAFWAGSLRSSHVDLTGTPVDFIGIGPVIGMNWHFFALEFGLYLGSGNNTKFFPYLKDPEAGSRFVVQFGFQLGFKALFWQ